VEPTDGGFGPDGTTTPRPGPVGGRGVRAVRSGNYRLFARYRPSRWLSSCLHGSSARRRTGFTGFGPDRRGRRVSGPSSHWNRLPLADPRRASTRPRSLRPIAGRPPVPVLGFRHRPPRWSGGRRTN